MAELAFLLAFSAIGLLLLSSGELQGVDPSGVLVGAAAYTAAMAFLVIIGSRGTPVNGLLLAGLGAAAVTGRSLLGMRSLSRRDWLLSLGMVGLVAVSAYSLRLTRAIGDSFDHLALAARLVDGDLRIAGIPFKRGISVAGIEAIGVAAGEEAAFGLLPAIGAAGLVSIAGLLRRHGTSRPIGLLAIAIVATNAQFLVHLFLINAHLITAFWVLVLIGLITGRRWCPESLVHPAPVFVVSIAIVAARPEGAILVALAVLPGLRRQLGAQADPSAVAASGWAILLWHSAHATAGFVQAPGLTESALILVGASLVLLATRPMRALTAALPITGIGLAFAWLAFAVGLVLHPRPLLRSVTATAINVGLDVGGWGVGLLLLTAVALAVRVRTRRPLPLGAGLLLGGFLPVALLLPLLDDGGSYRIGQSDSLNRMLFQLIPVLVVSVARAVHDADRSPWRSDFGPSR